jgi:hypothetical protein
MLYSRSEKKIAKLAAVIVLVMLTSLSVTGSATLVIQIHPDAKLEGYVTQYHSVLLGPSVNSQWKERWINNTAVNVRYREFINWPNGAYGLTQFNGTFERFPTTSDASAFVKNTCNGWNQPFVNISGWVEGYAYNRSTGHLPSVSLECNNFVNDSDNPHGYHDVVQLDDIVIYSAVTPLPLDYSSYFDRKWENSGMIIEWPFSESTNVRGNDVYMGILRNATQPGAVSVTIVEEFTKSQNESKQVYDQYVASRLSEGFTLRPDWVASLNASHNELWSHYEVWSGQNGGHEFTVMYFYSELLGLWEVTTEAS